MYFQFILPLLFINSDAFNLPKSPSQIQSVRGTELNVISRRDVFLTGAAALFGVVACPQPSFARESSSSIEPSLEKNAKEDEMTDTPIDLNGAFVAMGYASLAGSLISDGALDSSELQGLDANVLEECSALVDSNIASNIDVLPSVSDTSFLDGIGIYETDLPNENMNM
eukprot:CAMPEP_0197823926 /NCGR_PEP_ID=MMETSP1437-20131217/1246_1 /TAXON_ID=49252 ORGANISM="Eucampia antarctica, Strain CCMP1452" /NCGR_SAMPLE_ID=MMETSP1437 /ASSEMBLY_ACC=CAM_ASM_001096 /LENGTH=168 /DNA_ID=CAMNT_0043423339 /DNA_START=18 /DNA_END=524 /DNA_ORIENTATION=-